MSYDTAKISADGPKNGQTASEDTNGLKDLSVHLSKIFETNGPDNGPDSRFQIPEDTLLILPSPVGGEHGKRTDRGSCWSDPETKNKDQELSSEK